MNGILITINLPGRLGSRVEHTTKQIYSATITEKNNRPEVITKKILHTDRQPVQCAKELHISPFTMKHWLEGAPPQGIHPKSWKKLSNDQKIAIYVSSFDEGYGVSFE